MKLNKILGGLALTAILGMGFASCSNEFDGNRNDKLNNMLVRSPKAEAFMGDTKLSPFGTKSYGTRAAAGVTAQECTTTAIDREKEAAFIEEKLPEQNGNISDDMSTKGLFYAEEETTFELYPVYSLTHTENSLGVFYYDANGEYHEVIVWENMNPWGLTQTEWTWSEEKGSYAIVTSKGVQVTVPAGCTFGFYWKGHTNDAETVYYSDPSKNEEAYRTDGGGNRIQPEETEIIHAVSFEHDGKTYLGLEDWTDFDYQDWVFTCDKLLTPASSKPEGPDTPDINIPENPDPGFNVDPEDPDINIPENPDPGFTVDPENPDILVPDPLDPGFNVDPETPGQIVDKAFNEVEVNLALDEKEEKDVRSSHLSIHVRTATDVEIFIPVPRQYYCDKDDMAIVMEHEPNHMEHGGPHQFTWTLKDSDLQVSLYVEYEDDGIRIWTDGITQEVIDWCYEKCNDGITFEVWNYFNDEDGNPLLSNEELRKYLDQATIKFLDKDPDYYVNSFADPNGKYDAETNPNGDDFHVTPVNPDSFDEPYEGPHYNNSDFNDIYKKSDVQEEEPRPTPPPVPVY